MNRSKRKTLNKAGIILLHPLIIVIPFAVAVWILIPGIHSRYKCELVKTFNFYPQNQIQCTYVDFDHDGYSENFKTGIDNGILFCTLNNDNLSYQQYNFPGNVYTQINRHFTGDADHDGKPELFLFTSKLDSVFIHLINPVKRNESLRKSKLLTLVKDASAKGCAIMDAELCDLNEDGTSEVILAVNVGFQLTPRRVIAYDIVRDSVFMSPDFGAQVTGLKIFHEKGKPRIAVTNYASGNYSDTISCMDDHSSYMTVLDENLQFRYPPRRENGDFSSYFSIPFFHNPDTMILTLILATEKEPRWKLTLYDLEGNIIRNSTFRFDDENFRSFSTFINHKGNTVLMGEYNSELIQLDYNLETAKKIRIRTERFWNYDPDLDNEGNRELLFNSVNPGEMIILDDNLNYPVSLKVGKNGFVHPPSTILRGKEKPYFHLQIDSTSYTFNYSRLSPLLEYSVLCLVYLLIFGFTLMIRRIQKNQLKKKFETQQTISELKFLSIRNQMDPHFTFNILNTIGSVILQNKPDESYQMLMKYSKLLRSGLASSENLLGTIEEELKFVTNYLEVQKIRFKENLNYTLDISDDVDRATVIPRMAIHAYVENSVKHGLNVSDKPGVIEIGITKEASYICITITDNGIGRKQARQNGTESGKGQQIMHQFYSLLNEINKLPITEEIRDLVDPDGNAAGTEVVVRIPVGLRMK